MNNLRINKDKMDAKDQNPENSSRLEEGKDYVFNEEGLLIFTADYLRRRGFCCGLGCKNCPY